jgi:hypothetical protein
MLNRVQPADLGCALPAIGLLALLVTRVAVVHGFAQVACGRHFADLSNFAGRFSIADLSNLTDVRVGLIYAVGTVARSGRRCERQHQRRHACHTDACPCHPAHSSVPIMPQTVRYQQRVDSFDIPRRRRKR